MVTGMAGGARSGWGGLPALTAGLGRRMPLDLTSFAPARQMILFPGGAARDLLSHKMGRRAGLFGKSRRHFFDSMC